MRIVSFSLALILTTAFIIVLDNSWGEKMPPVGRLLDPVSGFYHNALNGLAETQDQDIDLSGLTDSATVIFDKQLIPHIYASNLADAYYLQGYVTARHRLWQMEVQTHAAAGRLTELFGESMLNYDKLARRRGMKLGAQKGLADMQKDSLSALAVSAYTKGINAYIEKLAFEDYPFEYKLLNYSPEKWTELKTAYLLMYMAQDLAGGDDDLENTNLVQHLGKSAYDSLYLNYLPHTDPVIPANTSWNFTPESVERPDSLFYPAKIKATTERPNPQNGSNNWAVNGNKTASGKPMLCNDPHLGLNLPSLWYAIQITTPELNVYGVSLPGAPGVIIGFNNDIAWGVTNATRDVKDWYRIQFKDSTRTEYKYDDQWLRTDKQIEKFKLVNNGFLESDSYAYDTLLYTHYGPVVYDRNYMDTVELAGYAMRWTAHDPGNVINTFLKLNRAKNLEDYQEALSGYRAPGQNFVFASVDNTIAMRIQGRFPIKWPEQGKFLMDGSNSAYEWKGYIPSEQNAMVVNPERNFVSSANQRPVDLNYPFYVYDDTYEHYRNRRINKVLAASDSLTAEDMMKLQNDNYSLQAEETLPYLLNLLDTTQLKPNQQEAVNYLKQWNYLAEASQLAPTLYYAWWNNFRTMLWDELDSLDFASKLPSTPQTAYFMQQKPNSPYFDYKKTPAIEDAKALALLSFQKTIEEIEDWQAKYGEDTPYSWGAWKASSILHLTRQPALSANNLMVDGGKSIVNANSGRHGASWRMIVELGKPMKAWVVYPGGQSGNPGSPYYGNMIENWRTAQYYSANFWPQPQPKHSEVLAIHHYSRKK